MTGPDFDTNEITIELGAVRHSIENPDHTVVVETYAADKDGPANVNGHCNHCGWWNQVLL